MDPTLYDAALRAAGPSWVDGGTVGLVFFVLALAVACWPRTDRNTLGGR